MKFLINKFKTIFNFYNYFFHKKKFPYGVSFALTYKCNFRCLYCGIWNSFYDEKELSLENIKRIILDIHNAGCKRIIFTGGEPLLRKDIYEILYFARELNLHITLNTNGSLLTQNQLIFKLINQLVISLDGNTETQLKMRPPGLFDNIAESIYLAKKHKIKIWLTAVLTNENISEIDFLINFAEKNNVFLDIESLSDRLIASKNVEKFRLCNSDLILFAEKLKKIKEERNYPSISNSVLKHISQLNKLDNNFYCLAGKIFFYIDPFGNIFPCPERTEINNINLNHHSLVDCLNSVKTPKCNKCYCNSVYEANQIFRGNLESLLKIINYL